MFRKEPCPNRFLTGHKFRVSSTCLGHFNCKVKQSQAQGTRKAFKNYNASGLQYHAMFCDACRDIASKYDEHRFVKWILLFHGIDPKKNVSTKTYTTSEQQVDVSFYYQLKRVTQAIF